MITGTKVTIGGKDFCMPPANFAALKKHKPLLDQILGNNIDVGNATMQQLEDMADLVYLALKRNYPQLTQAEFDDVIGLEEIAALMPAALKASGYEAATPGET